MMGQIFEREKPSHVTIQHRLCFYGRYELNKEGLYYYKDYIDNVLSPKDYYKLSDGNERFFAYDKKTIDIISIPIISLAIIARRK